MAFTRPTFRLRRTPVHLLAGVLLAAACDSASGPDEPRVTTVRIAPANPTLIVGGTQQLTATALDPQGTAIAGRSPTWGSSNRLIAEVDGAGLVRAAGVGTTQITATIDGVPGTTTVTVNPPPVSSVTVTAPATTLDVGASLQLTATPRDAAGTALSGRSIAWVSSQPTIATVDANGLVLGVAAGQTEIRATAENVTGRLTLTITIVGPALTITGIAPGTLTEGGTATVTGSGFAATPNANVVTVGGVSTIVTAATPTTLSFTLPTGTCLPSGQALVRVVANGISSGQVNHPFQSTRAPLTLVVGQQTIIRNPSDFCLHFGAAATDERYVFGITSTSEVANALASVQVSGLVPATASGSAGFAVNNTMTRAAGNGVSPVQPDGQRWARHRAAEAALRQQDLALFRTMPKGGVSAYSIDRASARVPSVPATVRLGDTVRVKIPNIRGNACTTSDSIRTVVRALGTRGVWLEDVGNPAGGFKPADFDSASAAFDTRIYPTNVEYFGEPSDRDGNGRIVIVTTKEVNRMGGILGFVTTTDYNPQQCPSSNDGEYYYGVAPDPSGQYSLGEFTLADALANMPILIAHEFAHVIQFTRRLANPQAASFLSTWEAEGQATFAEEINGHAATGNGTGQNYGFSVAWNDPISAAHDWYIGAFVDLALYYGFASQISNVGNAPEQCGWLAQSAQSPCLGSRNIYGVSWSFLRWISDQYGPSFPGGEKGLHRAIVNAPGAGFANISSVVGEDIDILLSRWAAALYLDDRLGNLAPELRFTSWNLTDIESRLTQTARLRPRERSFGSFTDEVAVRSGSTAYFRIGGANRPSAGIRIRSPSGAALPASLRVWIVRVQ